MISARGLTKRHRSAGGAPTVADLTFDVRPGRVTGLLGPPGAGKSTVLRMIVGLAEPDAGTVTIGGLRYRDLPSPPREVGALLDARAAHPGRTGRAHLRWLAEAGAVAPWRIDAVLATVGLGLAADRRVGDYSPAMGQRLGIAAALLGDPAVVLLDEPTDGLDPEGVAWLRRLLHGLAAQGSTVLVTGHQLVEMQQLADQVLVLCAGRLVADVCASRLRGMAQVQVCSPSPAVLAAILEQDGAMVVRAQDGRLHVTGPDAPRIGELAAANGVALYQLTTQRAGVESAFSDVAGAPDRKAVA